MLDEGAKLEPGDTAICDQCGGFVVMGTDGMVSARSDEAVKADPRFAPHHLEMLLEAQRAIRARARLLVTRDETGQHSMTMVAQPEGRKVHRGSN
jgi:hypothetical protein